MDWRQTTLEEWDKLALASFCIEFALARGCFPQTFCREIQVGYKNLLTRSVTRWGSFVTESEARRYPPSDSEARSDGYSDVLANAVEQSYDFNPHLATANVRQEVEDAVRDGRKDRLDSTGNLVCRYSIEQV